MLKIWGRRNSINVQKVMWCVHELGLAHERTDAGMAFGGNDQDWYLAMNPNGLVPTIDDDGVVLWESNTIVRYLAACHDAGGLSPEVPAARAQAEKWMDWQLGTVQPSLYPVFWGLVRAAPEHRDMATIEAAVERTGKLLGILDEQLDGRDYILGSALTVADIALGCVAHRWYAMDLAHPAHPHLRAWYARLRERPAFRENVMIPLS